MDESSKDYSVSVIIKHSKKMNPIETGLSAEFSQNCSLKALLFDIYGTLFISEAGDISHAGNSSSGNTAFMKTFQEAGIDTDQFDRNLLESVPELYISEIKKEHAKLKAEGIEYPEVVITEIWERMLLKLSNKSFPPDIINKTAVIYESVSNRTYPMPGVLEVLCFLRENKIKTGLISNAQFYTPFLFNAHFGKDLSALGFERDLSFFSYAYRRGKPDKLLFQEALQKLDKKYNIKPEEVLYTGNDMLNDIAAASSVGMKTALFAGDRRSLRMRTENPECSSISPDMVITELSQIRDIIKQRC